MIQSFFKISVFFVLITLWSCGEQKEDPSIESDIEIAQEKTYPITLKYDDEIDELIAQMTPEEKIGMLHGNSMFTTSGVERLGIPELIMADGPLGIREELHRDSWAPLGLDNDFATYFPAGGGLSASWNPELSRLFGESIGAEARARGKDILLAPAINIIRTPVCGRAFEYFSEDPFLNQKMVIPYVNGVQSKDVGVCVKHFAANNQETNRGTVDVLMSERALREIYLPGFKAAIVDANAYSVMGAYNKFRGDYLCENDYMLNTILKGEWGFKGVVISDWAAVHSTVKSLKNGLDIEMGSNLPFDEFFLAKPLEKALADGAIEESVLDEKVKRILRVMYSMKSFEATERTKGTINTPEHAKAAYTIASESVVLLKNDKGILPVDVSKINSIAVIGDNATRKHAAGGFGAGVKTKNEITPLQGLKNRLPENVTVNFAQGFKEIYADSDETKSHGRTISYDIDPELIAEAVAVAKKSDVAVIFAGSNRSVESEASDRPDIKLPFGQEKLIKAVQEANPNTIVVIVAAAPFDLTVVEKNSHALLWGWFNGNEAGHVFADVIMGKVNPSGKLPWTIPVGLKDSPAHATYSFPGDERVIYEEDILVGYRWFDTKEVSPLFPFGYGLSYTDFEFSDLKTNKASYTEDETIEVTFTIKNTGKADGKEVTQVYVSDPESTVEKAAQELKGFKKVFVKSGASERVSILIPAKALAYYDETKGQWLTEAGTYKIKVGNSSRGIKEEVTLTIQ